MALSVTYSFTNGTTAQAPEVNQNFADIVTYVNGQVVLKDASVAFTNVPSGPNTDPSSANHLTRKSYVDNLRSKVASTGMSVSGSTPAVANATWTQIGSNVSVAVTNGRYYRVALSVPYLQCAAAGTYLLGAGIFVDAEVAPRHSSCFTQTAANVGRSCDVEYLFQAAATATVAFKAKVLQNSGGAAQVDYGAGAPFNSVVFLRVYDLGV